MSHSLITGLTIVKLLKQNDSAASVLILEKEKSLPR